MGKVLILIGILYLLYYAGNVVYDLFIKTPAIVRNEDEGEVISLGNITEETSVDITNVSEEEVENLNMPESYILSDEGELFSDDDAESSGLNQNRFEEEQAIDNYNAVEEEPTAEEKNNQQSFLSKLSSALNIKEQDIISKNTELIPNTISDEMFRNFFDKASSHIVVGNESGQNFYRSSLVF
jgi:hypothetical protein